MAEALKLAKALGFEIRGHGQYFDPKGQLGGQLRGENYFRTPRGQQHIRDMVRELAGKESVAYYYEPGDELKHTVCVSSNELDFNPWLTENEAWQEALLWLTELDSE